MSGTYNKTLLKKRALAFRNVRLSRYPLSVRSSWKIAKDGVLGPTMALSPEESELALGGAIPDLHPQNQVSAASQRVIFNDLGLPDNDLLTAVDGANEEAAVRPNSNPQPRSVAQKRALLSRLFPALSK